MVTVLKLQGVELSKKDIKTLLSTCSGDMRMVEVPFETLDKELPLLVASTKDVDLVVCGEETRSSIRAKFPHANLAVKVGASCVFEFVSFRGAKAFD